jgi:transaldolase
LYLDSIDPELVRLNLKWGAVGATSNPIIVAGLIESGRFDSTLHSIERDHPGLDDEAMAWELTDRLVCQAQSAFLPIWDQTQGNAGWVSFELDPLLEDPQRNMPHAQRVAGYIELGRRWSAGHRNRMIKVPATPAGLESLAELTASGVTLNVTLIFSLRQYEAAREAIWRGAQRRSSLAGLKSVYSIFVSRVDQYTRKALPQLSPGAQGTLGILNAKRIWQANQAFWRAHPTRLQQEIIFASTGTKDASDPPWKYVAALAGSDIQTNPPETNAAVAQSSQVFSRQVDAMPPAAIMEELDQQVNMEDLEHVLMEEGIAKFAAPQHALIATIAKKRSSPTAPAGTVPVG